MCVKVVQRLVYSLKLKYLFHRRHQPMFVHYSKMGKKVAFAINNNDWTPVRALVESVIPKDSVEYTQLQQILVNYNIILNACSRGFTELVSIFLKNGFPVNGMLDKSTDRRMIHLAAFNGHLSLVKQLINSGANIDCKTCDGNAPLYYAVKCGRLDIVKQLISAGAGVNTCDLNDPIKDYSIFGSHSIAKEMYKLLLDSGCHLTTRAIISLFWAVRFEDIKCVKILLDTGAHVNGMATDIPLHEAALNGNISIMELLLEYEADINARDKYGDTALHKAVVNSKIQSVKFLLDHGSIIDPVNNDQKTPLLLCISSRQFDIAMLLINSCADLNLGIHHTVLHGAVSADAPIHMIECLLDHGSPIDSVNNDQKTPLLLCISSRQFDIAMLLINSGADLNLDVHNTVLHKAIDHDAPVQLIECLLEHGANVTTVYHNVTALQSVIYDDGTVPYTRKNDNWRLHVAKLLLIYGANHYVDDCFERNTLLHWACMKGDVQLVEYLIGYGLNLDAKNWRGKTPYDIATDKRYYNIKKAIIKYHCKKYTNFD